MFVKWKDDETTDYGTPSRQKFAGETLIKVTFTDGKLYMIGSSLKEVSFIELQSKVQKKQCSLDLFTKWNLDTAFLDNNANILKRLIH